MTALREYPISPDPASTEVSVAGSLAAAEAALRQVMADAEALRWRAGAATTVTGVQGS